MKRLSIGALSRATGVKATTIRWYEDEGLLPPPARTEGGHRAYDEAHLRRLGFIRHARELGFAMPAIRSLLDLADHPERDCGTAHGAAAAQVAAIDARIRRLQALRAELVRVPALCAGGPAAACGILEVLADHAHGHCLDAGHGGPDGAGHGLADGAGPEIPAGGPRDPPTGDPPTGDPPAGDRRG
ncbi:MerR family transcriptional regulator [Roseomonas acroporae]